MSYGIQIAYYAARKYYTTVLELDTGKGYADVVYLPAPRYSEKPAMLIELRYGRTKHAAMEQIRRQRYLDRFEHYKGNTLVIGINYDRDIPANPPEFKHHTCRIQPELSDGEKFADGLDRPAGIDMRYGKTEYRTEFWGSL